MNFVLVLLLATAWAHSPRIFYTKINDNLVPLTSRKYFDLKYLTPSRLGLSMVRRFDLVDGTVTILDGSQQVLGIEDEYLGFKEKSSQPLKVEIGTDYKVLNAHVCLCRSLKSRKVFFLTENYTKTGVECSKVEIYLMPLPSPKKTRESKKAG